VASFSHLSLSHIFTVFPVFGATAGSVAVLPLAFILAVTAIKDGIEDYRRGVLDEEVNTSAATKLGGGWKNVNQRQIPVRGGKNYCTLIHLARSPKESGNCGKERLC